MNFPLVLLVLAIGASPLGAAVSFEGTSPYHHIRVIDHQGFRTLRFDASIESRISLRNPLQGHFEYIDYFHMPWLWNTNITNALMIGLGGASIQRSYLHYYPEVMLETAEIDSLVVQVAMTYFLLKENPKHQIHIADGRVHLRRTRKKHDAIIVDAYTASRYGSFIPYHLATREFFQLAADHLTEQGVVAFNVMGTLYNWRSDIVGAVYRTMKTVFPQVYLFPAQESLNVVLIATKTSPLYTAPLVEQKTADLIRSQRIKLPSFRGRVRSFRNDPPPAANAAPVLTDNYAPVDGLLRQAAR